jgi:dynein heavy chain, axonemal
MIRRERGQESAQNKEKEKDKEAEMEEANQESLILMRAIKDMNLPKFIQDDIFLFNALFNDLFPNMDLQDTVNIQF